MAIGEIKGAPPRRPTWFGWRALRSVAYLAAIVLVVAALAPTIISWTGLRHLVLQRATAGLPVSVTVQNLSLGWFTPVTLEGVAIHAQDGTPLATIPKIETQRSLASLAMSRKDFGKIRIERPELEVVFADNTSNLEKLFATPPGSPPPTNPTPPANPSSMPKFAVEIVEGTIRVKDTDIKKEWQIDKVEGNVSHDPSLAQSISGRIQANVTGDGDPGSLDLRILEAKTRPRLEAKWTANASGLPVSLIGPFLRRACPEMACSGRLDIKSSGTGYLTPDRSVVFSIGGDVDGQNLEVAGGTLGPDRFPIRHALMKLVCTYNGYQILINKSDLECDIGTASAKGRIDLGKSMVASFGEPGTEFKVDVDLSEVAQRLPNTLKLHKDVRLTGGKLHMDGRSIAVNNGAAWDGKLTTSEIRGVRGVTPITWEDPLSMSFKVRQASPSVMPEVEELRCTSKFLTVQAANTSKLLTVEAVADLGQLSTSVSQFIDLGTWGIGGRANATMKLKRQADTQMSVEGSGTLERFQWGPWREQNLTVRIDGQGHKLDAEKLKLDKGTLRVTGGADDLEITLREPVVFSSSIPQSGFVYAKLDGDLANWQQRLKSFTSVVADCTVSGHSTAEVWLAFAPNRFEIKPVVLSAKNIDLTYGGFRVVDPEMNINASLLYDSAAQTIEMKASEVKGRALTLFTDKFRVDMKKKSMAGQVTFLGDLARLQEWAPKTPGAPASPDGWSGSAWGQVDLRAGDDGFDIDAKSTIKALAYGPPGRPAFSDPNVNITGRGRFDGPKGLLNLDSLQIASQLGLLDAKAQFSKLDTTMDLDVKGTLAYDLIHAQPLLKTYLGAGARIEGKDRKDFRLVGPLRPRGAKAGVEFAALEGNVGAAWSLLFGYGAAIGPADVKANLKTGSLRFDPIAASINGGRLTLTPTVRLDPTPHELTLPAGPVIEGAKVTPQLCASALGYTLPLIANAAQADGEISFRLDSARVPLAEPNKSEVRGTLTLHQAKVSAGPILSELMNLVKVGNTLSLVRENNIPVKLENGRVYHENLELIFPENFTIKTNGSVGLDGTLAMTAEMPIPAKLLGNLKLPVAIARNPIKLPIGGTVDRPTIDPRALQEILVQAGRDAAGDLIKQKLEDQLKKFLLPKK